MVRIYVSTMLWDKHSYLERNSKTEFVCARVSRFWVTLGIGKTMKWPSAVFFQILFWISFCWFRLLSSYLPFIFLFYFFFFPSFSLLILQSCFCFSFCLSFCLFLWLSLLFFFLSFFLPFFSFPFLLLLYIPYLSLLFIFLPLYISS